MSMTIGVAIASMNIAKSVAAYTGLIESSSANISSLVHQALKSALMNLDLARTASTGSQSEEYLREARNKFVEAIAVEKDESLVSAYTGLAMCQYLLGDRNNAVLTVRRIAEVELSAPEMVKAGAKSAVTGTGSFFGPVWSIVNAYHGAKEREESFNTFKGNAMAEMGNLK